MEKKDINMFKSMIIADGLKKIQADHIFNYRNEIGKLFCLFFTIEQEKIDKEYIIEKINNLLSSRPLSLSYEPALLAYCLNRGFLLDRSKTIEKLLEECIEFIKKEGIIKLGVFDLLDELKESQDE